MFGFLIKAGATRKNLQFAATMPGGFQATSPAGKMDGGPVFDNAGRIHFSFPGSGDGVALVA